MDNLIKNLSAIVGRENVLSKPDELLVYECDGLPQHKARPRAVVFPSSTEQTSAVMKELAEARVPFTPRGAGTGLSGGALALNSGVVVELARMRKILRIDPENRLAVVQPGVVNLQVSRAVASFGLYYVPDPSSQPTCTIGGNIAESAGGIHCLKYGTTTDHVLGCRVVLVGGEIINLGSAGIEAEGYDLLGTFIGSEGTFGIVTEATLRLVQTPPSVRTLLAEFGEVDDASHAVSAIIAAGVMPAALEMMDREIIRAIEASVFAAGLPPDAGAALLVELDGIDAGIDDEAARVTDICLEYGARNCRAARDETERKKLWAARKGAFGAIGRISPDSMIQDAVVPRSRLPEVLSSAYDIAAKYNLKVANVFHAGDGNLHPLICFDSRFPDEVRRVKEAGRELMEVCVAAGGTITGEHGVGLDKRELLPLVFSDADMNAMLRVRAAFDPLGLCNPGKIIPVLRGCGEGRAVAELLPASDSEAQTSPTTASVPPLQPTIVVRSTFDLDVATKRFKSIVGNDNVAAKSFHNLEIHNGSLLVLPASTAEVSEVVKLATDHGWSVAPVGSGTWLNRNSECMANVVVSTARMNRIIEHEPADLIAVAEAGVKLSDFNRKLSENAQWLPLDPPDDGSSTLGGVVATGLGGSQEFAYGRARGSVIGMKVVLSDGSVIKAGGRVVKNVAGYDLCKLFTGSFGTLGVITELNFKLRPKPLRERTIVANGAASRLIAIAQTILHQKLFPVATELISSALAGELGIESKPSACALLVRFAGNDKGVTWQIKQAVEALSHQDIKTRTVDDDTSIWQSLAAAPLSKPRPWSFRISVLPSRVNELLTRIEKLNDDVIVSSKWQLGIAAGLFRVMDQDKQFAALLPQINEVVKTLDGRMILEEGFDAEPSAESFTTMNLMRRVKRELDPTATFLAC